MLYKVSVGSLILFLVGQLMLQPLAAVVTTFSVSNGAKPTVTSYGNNLKVDPDNDHRNNSIKWVSDQVGGPGGDYWSDVGFINNTNHYRPWRFFCKGGSRVNGIQMDFRDWANDLMNSKPDKTSSWRGGKGGSGGEPTATLKANWHSPMEFEEGEYIITVTMGLCKHTMHDHNRICYLELRTNRDRGEGTFKCGAPRPNETFTWNADGSHGALFYCEGHAADNLDSLLCRFIDPAAF